MFTLITLPYAKDALEPVISAKTLEFHHGKHLQAYVDNLNKLIQGAEFEGKSLVEIVKSSTGGIFNNAGQILNHEMYFTQFVPKPSLPAPTGNLMSQIANQWGTFDAFKSEFESKGVSLFGSGWVWLAAKENGELVILQCPGADNPVCHFERSQLSFRPSAASGEISLRPLLTFDVWEHAYYLDYQNRRAAHLSALWQIVNWKVIENRYSN